jgi:hypothetical protein
MFLNCFWFTVFVLLQTAVLKIVGINGIGVCPQVYPIIITIQVIWFRKALFVYNHTISANSVSKALRYFRHHQSTCVIRVFNDLYSPWVPIQNRWDCQAILFNGVSRLWVSIQHQSLCNVQSIHWFVKAVSSHSVSICLQCRKYPMICIASEFPCSINLFAMCKVINDLSRPWFPIQHQSTCIVESIQ